MGAPQAPAFFHLVAPCRAFDTRSGLPLDSGATRTFVLAGACGIPEQAVAVAGNLTLVAPTGDGDISVYPSGFCLTNASSLHSPPGRTRANNAVFTLGIAGGVDVYFVQSPPGTADLIIDVVGYFE